MDGAAAADVASADAIGSESGLGGQHIEQLLQRLLLPRIKAALGEPNLAVRQVQSADHAAQSRIRHELQLSTPPVQCH